MHVLITNDDGPPNDEASPYIIHLVNAIKTYTDWTVSVCLPNTQRSWIGTAHLAGKDLTASFISPSLNDNSYEGPYSQPKYTTTDDKEEWALIDGTPASSADIGYHHLFQDKGPIDLVISGPNYGRNSTALYIMSSGTVGAAIEAALFGAKSIALSFAFNTRSIPIDSVKQASKLSVFLIEKLYKDWPKDNSVELYSVNIPLTKSLNDRTKIYHAPILENKWGSAYSHDFKSQSENIEADIFDSSTSKKIQFKWAPNYGEVHKSVAESQPGNDGWVLQEGCISVTPLKAVFRDIPIAGEITLDLPSDPTTPVNETLDDGMPTKFMIAGGFEYLPEEEIAMDG